MNDVTNATETATAAREMYCVRCAIATVAREGDKCDRCQSTLDTEVDKLLGKHNVTRESVSMGASAEIPVTADEDEAFKEREVTAELPNTDWVDDLIAERDAKKTAHPKQVSLIPNDIESIENSLTQARENSGQAAKKVAAELVPEFGNQLQRLDPTALAFGFPPAVDTLIKKASLTPEQTSHLLINFKDLFVLTANMRNELALVDPRSVEDTAAIAKAKELHTTLRNERINAEKRKKIIKEPYLRPSQLIDGVFKIWMDEINPLEAEARHKAEYVENLERERKKALAAERAGKLALFEVREVSGFNLGEISDEAFDVIYQGAMSSYQARRAEEQRIAKERAEREAEQAAENARLRAENERIENERKIEAERTAAANRIAEEERQKAKAAQDELDRQEELRKAEERRIAVEAEKRRLAPDRDKLLSFADDLEKFAVPEVDTKFAGFILQIEMRQKDLVEFIRTNVDRV